MPNYIAQQGDCINSIAFQCGFFPDTIWNHAQNADLKAKRKDPNVIYPGDTVFIPDKILKHQDAAVDQQHSYTLKGTPAKLKLRLLNNGKPRANVKYVLTVDGVLSQGTTDGDGSLEEPIAPNAKQAQLTLSDTGQQIPLNLGALDPIEEISGIQSRLRGLGFYNGDSSGDLDTTTQQGLAAFQKSKNLPQTGNADQATQDALKAAFGS